MSDPTKPELCEWCGAECRSVAHRWNELRFCLDCGDLIANLDIRLLLSRMRDGKPTGKTGDFYEGLKKLVRRPGFAGEVERHGKDIPVRGEAGRVKLPEMPVAEPDDDHIPDEMAGGGEPLFRVVFHVSLYGAAGAAGSKNGKGGRP